MRHWYRSSFAKIACAKGSGQCSRTLGDAGLFPISDLTTQVLRVGQEMSRSWRDHLPVPDFNTQFLRVAHEMYGS